MAGCGTKASKRENGYVKDHRNRYKYNKKMKKAKEVNLKKILAQVFAIAANSESFLSLGLKDEQLLQTVVLTAMKEACEQTIKLCVDNAAVTTKKVPTGSFGIFYPLKIVDKKSIKNTLKQIV